MRLQPIAMMGSIGLLMAAMLAINLSRCQATQEAAGWGGAQVATTDLLTGETNHGKFVYFFASVTTRAGCHVAKVEGERGKGVFVRRDGRRGKTYEDIAHPVFSPDGSTLAYAVRGAAGSFLVINEREDPSFEEIMPDTFAFGGDGKRYAYLAKRDGRLVAVVDGGVQPEAGDDMVPWLQAPVFSADGSSVGYLEGSRLRKKMRAVVNGKSGETFDGVGLQSLLFSPDGKHFAYGANDRSTGDRWFYVRDGRRSDAFDTLGVGSAFSPDGKRFAHTGRRGMQWFLLVDGERELQIQGIVDHSLSFSPDSQRLAYAVAQPDTRCHIVVDGKPGLIYDSIGASQPPLLNPGNSTAIHGYGLGGFLQGVVFSPDSRRLAYVASKQLIKRMMILDGKPEGVEMSFVVGGLVFSDDSKRLAYGGRRGDTFFLVADGKKGTDYDGLGYFGFSPDGKHIAFVAKKGDKFVIVVDGQERVEYASVPAGPVFRSDGVLEYLGASETSLYRVEVRNL